MKDLDIKKIQPTKGYVLVQPAKAEEKTSSGIILPENESEKPQYGVVLALGEADCSSCCADGCGDDCCGGHEEMQGCCGGGCGCDHEDEEESSSCCTPEFKVGDKVIYKKWGGNEFKIGETEYQFLKFEDILAIIK